MAAVLEDSAPIDQAVGKLWEMEGQFAVLSATVQEALRSSEALTQNALALHMVLSLLFTVCTRVSFSRVCRLAGCKASPP